MGICNAPPSFQWLMELVPLGLHWSECLIYLDDIIIHSPDFRQHFLHLRDVFLRFRSAGLKHKPSNVTWHSSQSHSWVQPDPVNTAKIGWARTLQHSAPSTPTFNGLGWFPTPSLTPCLFHSRVVQATPAPPLPQQQVPAGSPLTSLPP
ncbi:hypothetical protein SKAU_G00232000 [Synaphobranchus kaupii]|uniref:Reverse transcriptase domain-containing protein n=1 Tax=Synaphobranchus kaupii TaxID=118154 RepID=A0A9Q1F5V7_SYNKA|nr:hypothetical protein SKAU_G00232000 [Synaphobranchus kaupii]